MGIHEKHETRCIMRSSAHLSPSAKQAAFLFFCLQVVVTAEYSQAGDSSYPHNYVYDVTLQNEKLTLENRRLKEQMLKLDHKKACLDARSYHRTLVDATATSTIRDLNSTVKLLSDRLQAEWTRNNHLTEENYNLT